MELEKLIHGLGTQNSSYRFFSLRHDSDSKFKFCQRLGTRLGPFNDFSLLENVALHAVNAPQKGPTCQTFEADPGIALARGATYGGHCPVANAPWKGPTRQTFEADPGIALARGATYGGHCPVANAPWKGPTFQTFEADPGIALGRGPFMRGTAPSANRSLARPAALSPHESSSPLSSRTQCQASQASWPSSCRPRIAMRSKQSSMGARVIPVGATVMRECARHPV